jgi:exodeoxyribonuclease VII large subunit
VEEDLSAVAGEPEGKPEGTELASLEALNQRLKEIVEDKTRGRLVCVKGTAYEVSRTRSGNVHLRLRQGKYGLGCVVFRGVVQTLPFRIADGQTLTVRGQVQVDAVWGELQLVALGVELERAETSRKRLTAPRARARARAEGWLDAARKRPMPRLPQTVGLIAGEQSKAREDVMGSLRDSGLKASIVLEPALMQGPEAAEEIRSALSALNARPDIEAIVIARGGGSKGELAAFDDWALAQAIVASRAPVITAIGHRQDESLADLVADVSVPTPSMVGAALAGKEPVRWEVMALALVAIVVALLVVARALGWA